MKISNSRAVSNKKREVLFFEIIEYRVIFIAHTFFDLCIQVVPVCARAATLALARGDRLPVSRFEYNIASDACSYAAEASNSVLRTVVVVLLV